MTMPTEDIPMYDSSSVALNSASLACKHMVPGKVGST